MLPKTLSTRVSVLAGGLALVVVASLSVVLIRTLRRQALDEMVHTCNAVADAIRLSIEQDMLENTPERIARAIVSIGEHADITGVRLFDKVGRIAYSTDREEIGHVIDRSEEGCVECHGGDDPLRELPLSRRSRTYRDGEGRDVLATINIIPNEPACVATGCHQDPKFEPILGVLDVGMPLDPVRRRLSASTRTAMLASVSAMAFISLALFLVIRRSLLRPVQTLVDATRRVAGGDLDPKALRLPERTSDELVFLANSFHEMVESLSSAQAHEETWIRDLRRKVAERAAELRDVRARMVEAEKMSAVGLIAAGIAHELNSPLMAIVTFTHLTQKRFERDSREYKDLQMVREQADRCAAIIRNLLDFAREPKEHPERVAVRIEEVVERALGLVRPQARSNDVRIDFTADPDVPEVEVDAGQIVQVFINLLINAIQAMREGGVLSVRVARAPAPDAEAGLKAADPDGVKGGRPRGAKGGGPVSAKGGGPGVCVSFRDTGHGIPSENLDRVFDPFFTTKGAGQGFGLGLSVSHGIVRRHGGSISVASDGTSWSEFTVTIPARVPAESSPTQELPT